MYLQGMLIPSVVFYYSWFVNRSITIYFVKQIFSQHLLVIWQPLGQMQGKVQAWRRNGPSETGAMQKNKFTL